MQKLKLVLLVLGVVVLGGCVASSPRVVDNVYSSSGTKFVVASDLKYLGEQPREYTKRCSGAECSGVPQTSSTVVTDSFIREEFGVLGEFVEIRFSKAGNRYYKGALSGKKVMFHGQEYVERLFIINTKEDFNTLSDAIINSGVSLGAGIYGRVLLRNIDHTRSIILIYGQAKECIAHDSMKNLDSSRLWGFIEEEMEKAITVQ